MIGITELEFEVARLNAALMELEKKHEKELREAVEWTKEHMGNSFWDDGFGWRYPTTEELWQKFLASRKKGK